jgi:hypothetical protein
MRDLENGMVLGNPPGWNDRISPDKCAICGDEEYDMLDTWRGTICSSCSRKCLWCNDWMEQEDGIQFNDGSMHKACHEDWRREND